MLNTADDQTKTTMKWHLEENKICDLTDVIDWLKNKETKAVNNGDKTKLIVGTDSQLQGYRFRFITCVCLITEGKGGDFVFGTSYEDRVQYKGNQKTRMFKEVEKSVEVANMILEKTGNVAEIHIDASPSFRKNFTSSFSDSLVGYATANGFDAKIKPDSVVSSCIADRLTK